MDPRQIHLENGDTGDMGYENFVRWAHGGCDRLGVPGANADIFRSYGEVVARYRGNTPGPSSAPQATDFELGLAMGRVATFLEDALGRIKARYHGRMDQAQKDTLEECEKLLKDPSEENIDRVIEEGNRLAKSLDR